jgi:hypothetical protein
MDEIKIKEEESKHYVHISMPVKSRTSSFCIEETPHISSQLSIKDFKRSNSLPENEELLKMTPGLNIIARSSSSAKNHKSLATAHTNDVNEEVNKKAEMEIQTFNEIQNIYDEEKKDDIPYKPASKERDILCPLNGKSSSFGTKTIPPKTLKKSSKYFVRSISLPVEEERLELKPCMAPISRSSSVAAIVRTGRQTPTLDRNENRTNESK